MNWQKLLDPKIQDFIREHEKSDVAALGLKKPPHAEWDYPAILDQIKSRQKAAIKAPQWAATKGIIFPPPAVMEQASSEATARYKASLASGEYFIDLTGGAGADALAFAQYFKRGTIIEIAPENAALLKHNLGILSPIPLEILTSSAEDFVSNMPQTDLVYIDPMRRDANQKGRFRFEDGTPDILKMLPHILPRTQTIIIKASPMLDITEGIKQLQNVRDVHTVEYDGDCKELLFVLQKTPPAIPHLRAVKINEQGFPVKSLSFTLDEEAKSNIQYAPPRKYLYEPGPAFQKSGGFKTLATRFDVLKLSPQTHLYTSDTLKPDFPGRIFKILGTYPAQAEKLPIKKANLTIRNFPMSVNDLRKKLKIAEGGSDTLFACTLENSNKILVHCQKSTYI